MSIDDTLAKVTELVRLLPGVELAWTQKTPSFIRVGLIIRSAESLGVVAHVAVLANVPLHVETDWNCPGGHDDPSCVRYDLRVRVESGPSEPPSNLELVGGLLAGRLKDQGSLDPAEADRLRRAWNFAVE